MNMRTTITKADFLAALQCKTQAWHGMRTVHEAPTEAERFRMQQGQEVGALAQLLYPKGVLASKRVAKSAIEVTQELIREARSQVVFEAKFVSDQFVAKADILIQENGNWHAQEVKSSFSDTSSLDELVDDLAYTVMVCRRAGLAVGKASLILLSRDFRFGDGPDRLFKFAEKTNEVNTRVAEFDAIADDTARTLLSDNPPGPVLVAACRTCPYFTVKCLGTGLEFTVLELPRLSKKSFASLSADGITDLSKLPRGFSLNTRQARVRDSVLAGRAIVEPGLATALQTFRWPCYYLDFETAATVLPLYQGHTCHRQTLTQFSIHHRENAEGPLRHSEYLADAMRDCERELADSLINTLGEVGSIVVYSHFERTRITALRDRFGELAGRLQAILDRLVDLLPIIADHVYHPKFKGSYSLKRVLPALVPDLSYEGLDVRDGNTAISRFARMARREITGPEVETTRRQLFEYCKLDTLAMVRLHEALQALTVRIQDNAR